MCVLCPRHVTLTRVSIGIATQPIYGVCFHLAPANCCMSPPCFRLPAEPWKTFPRNVPLCAQWGGGVYISGSSTVVEFNDCNIHDNEASVRRPPCLAVTAIPAGPWKNFPRHVPPIRVHRVVAASTLLKGHSLEGQARSWSSTAATFTTMRPRYAAHPARP